VTARGAALFVLTLACGSPGPSAPAPAPIHAGAEPIEAAPAEVAPDPVEPRPPAGPAPTLAVRAVRGRSGHVSIAIENRGTDVARLGALEVVRDGETAATLALRDDCEHDAPECRELLPGGALHPPPWLGTIGDAQCACDRCADAEPGSYAIVVTTCDGAHRLSSPPFAVP
jgi:hypothetical protein